MNRRNFLKTAGAAGAGLFLMPNTLYSALQNSPYTRADFGPDWQWGVATAAYQIEGAWNEDGKGESIWDRFSHTKGKIKGKDTGDVACDFYHRYPQDLELMARLNIPNNRFSLSWSRILPEGTGKVNPKGIDFYHKVIDKTLELGMEPWVTIFHWDLPQALQDKGGWMNRESIGWFSEYANLVTREYGDKVKNWMVLNEPMAFVSLGHLLGWHAPGKKGFGKFTAAAHHASMVQAEGGRIVRANVSNANVGTTQSVSFVDPYKDKPGQQKTARRLDAMLNRIFIEPSLGLGYPFEELPYLQKKIDKVIQPGDLDKLKFDFDFIGLQTYSREVFRHVPIVPVIHALRQSPKKRGHELTEMGWEVYPEAIYQTLKKFNAYPGVKKIIVTENGAAFPDKVEGDQVHDAKRTQFIQDYLGQVLRAKQEGMRVGGYFVWSFMDNFEWAEGYKPRFGLVHVDFETQKRTVKDSGIWYRDFLAGK
ncbi:MAG: beta-glucosidase [Bacteroidia bacterium]|nr:beta-glucosidase [Bacteroidia bacterium]